MRELNYIDETIEKDENPALRIGSVGRSALSTVYLMDCIEGMKQFPDKIFDLAVVYPPYGIGAGSKKFINGTSKTVKDYYKENDWDKERPTQEFFTELKRVSKNQIVWGGNYFADLLGAFRCFIFWDKTIHGNSYADGELAWTSFNGVARYYRKNIAQVNSEGRMHPTQKPITLYDYVFTNFASEGDLILDTHLGSQSSRIAANKAGLDFVGFEIDREYFDNGNKRFKNFVSQTVLF
jgi:site-specific DNA-methyltransferase (adenine-specific)